VQLGSWLILIVVSWYLCHMLVGEFPSICTGVRFDDHDIRLVGLAGSDTRPVVFEPTLVFGGWRCDELVLGGSLLLLLVLVDQLLVLAHAHGILLLRSELVEDSPHRVEGVM
jgi:hypothetical protein